MTAKNSYAGKIGNCGAQKVEALFSSEKKATAKTAKGADLRCGMKERKKSGAKR